MSGFKTHHKGAWDREADKFKEIPRGDERQLGDFPESDIGPADTESVVKVIAVPFVCASDGSVIPSPDAALKARIQDDSVNPDICYVGNAVVGELEASPVWRIKRITSTTVGLIESIDVDFADGDDLYNNIWDDRETLSYA